MKLTTQDIQNNLIFLERCDLKGKEAQAMTELQMKLSAMLQQPAMPPARDDEIPIEDPLPDLTEE